MSLPWFFLVVGSAVLAFALSWQVKYVPPAVGPVVRYNLVILPLIFLANVLLGIGFVKAHRVLKNLPLLAAGQTFMYYLFLLAFSIFLAGDRVSVARAVVWDGVNRGRSGGAGEMKKTAAGNGNDLAGARRDVKMIVNAIPQNIVPFRI